MRYLKENLVFQFSVISFVVMAVIAVVLAIVLSNKIRSDAVDTLVNEAVGASRGRLLSVITPADLEVPMTGERYDRFHKFVQQSIVSERTARVKIWAKDGTVIYANDPKGVGEKYPAKPNLLTALRGENAIEIKIPQDPENERERFLGTLMEVYTPIIFPGSSEPQGSFEVYQYYAPTADRINSLHGWLFGAIAVGFVILYGGLISTVWGGWRTIARQRSRLESFNTELEEQVQERTAQLQVANRELEALAYAASHDLRAPLQSIDGFSQLLVEDYAEKLDTQGKDYLQHVRTASQRMGQPINDLLSLSRVTHSEMRCERVDLSTLARETAAELQRVEPERQIEFIVAEGMVAEGDGGLLRVALDNLLGNAWKFISKHPRARIEVGVTQHEGKPAYFVRDGGAGFDMAYTDKLFGAIQRLHSPSKFGGTGIGLATVQRIIHRHQGRI